MATQVQRTASARARLLNAAAELVGQQGSVLTSLAEIGTAAGASRGAVNFHFGSKRGLMAELLEAKTREWSTFGPSVDETHGRPIGEVLDAHWSSWSAEPVNSRLALMLMHDALGPSPELLEGVRETRRAFEHYVSDEVAALQGDGRFPPHRDRRAVAQAILAGLVGVLSTWIAFGEAERDAAYREFRAALIAQAAH